MLFFHELYLSCLEALVSFFSEREIQDIQKVVANFLVKHQKLITAATVVQQSLLISVCVCVCHCAIWLMGKNWSKPWIQKN